jgi:cytochrome c-type protein NapB
MYTDKELSSTDLGTNDHLHTEVIQSVIDLKSCKGCHGKNFEKAALGKSNIVSNMTTTQVTAALIGYKHGTYGGSMKNMMTNNVKMYTDKELSQTGIGCNLAHKKIYKSSIKLDSCKGCHGVNFEKAALGQSKVVSNMTKEEVTNALIGYKNGTYGRSMKNMMKSNIDMYSEEELKHTGIGQ